MLTSLHATSVAVAMMVMTTDAHAGATAALDSLVPSRQRVGEMITLRGGAFGVYTPGVSRIVFASGDLAIEAGTPYVWRDDFIQVRVPAGQRIDGTNVPIPPTELEVRVIGVHSESAPLPFQIITSSLGILLPFDERTNIVNDRDVSTVLGDPNLNLARTKDAEFADVDGDGWIDLIDNNSNNVFNQTHGVLRRNEMGQGFEAIEMEPLSPGDPGEFATTILAGGDYMGDSTTYDADFIDLDNDDLPDYVQTAARGDGNRLRVLMNNYEGVPGRFVERTDAWTGGRILSNCPDDLAHADVNNDGWIDVAACLRSFAGTCGSQTSSVEINLNLGGTAFAAPIVLSAPANQSSHDVFFLDADADGYKDVFMVNETGNVSQLFMHDGQAIPGFAVGLSVNMAAFTGLAADFNADGLDDFVLAGVFFVVVFLNDPDDPGTFTSSALPGATSLYYDIEVGDIDLDGTIDIVAAAITDVGENTIGVWRNDGDGTFTHATPGGASDVLPGIGNYQRLSADLFDFDRDGDLDLYVVGADGQDVGGGQGFGRTPNQLFASVLTCRGDVNGDRSVDFEDILAALASWGPCGVCTADLDADGVVSFGDILIVLANWGPCPL